MSFDYKRLIQFEHNIGTKEAKMRMMIGAAALFISIFTASILLLIVGLVMVAEGYVGWCPMYSALHKNTCETKIDSTEVSE
ncbi:MAG: hypothetical protein RL637_1159 [Pseudomonadota bacterium]|jgi:cytochrome b subunit of formate dehydrogenase